MDSEIKILLSIESLNIFHSTSKKDLADYLYIMKLDATHYYSYFNNTSTSKHKF